VSKRRPFVPAAPNFAALEDRLAPSNIFGLGHGWDRMVSKLGLHHHSHNSGNTGIIEQAWKASAKDAAAAHHHAHVAAKAPVIFK